jgi:hypothetical protein
VRLRQLPPVTLLGLLAALLAHTAGFGNDHAAGGPYHGILSLLALLGVGGVAVCAVAWAWAGARQADGSVLAARLAPLSPRTPLLALSATLWYVGIERCEGPHVVHPAPLLVAVMLLAAAWLVATATRAFVRAIARIVLAFATHAFAQRAISARRVFTRPSSARRTAFINRRLARPPPAVMHVPA